MRILLFLTAGVSLILGLLAALLLLGLDIPLPNTELATVHGILMVFGFLGTLIALERAGPLLAHGFRWRRAGFIAPAASAIAVVLTALQLEGAPIVMGRWLPGAAWKVGLAALSGPRAPTGSTAASTSERKCCHCYPLKVVSSKRFHLRPGTTRS